MPAKVIIRRRHGSTTDAFTEFPLRAGTAIRFGRAPGCEVLFRMGDGVGREHCRMDVESETPPACQLTDLGSRNGTYVNRRRISGSVTVRPGDVIQLGPGGPEVQFSIQSFPPAPGKTRTHQLLAAAAALLALAAALFAVYRIW